jgi:DME family drug/metabolite transporter
MGRTRTGLVLVSCAGVVWGTIGPAVQLVHDGSGLSPLTIGAFRAIAAVTALVVASLVTGRLHTCLGLARSHWRRVIITGLSTAAFQLLFFVAVVATGVSVATVVSLGLPPVLLLGLSSIQGRRGPSPAQVMTVATALVGLLLVSIAGGTGEDAPNAALGVLAALGSGTAKRGVDPSRGTTDPRARRAHRHHGHHVRGRSGADPGRSPRDVPPR